MAGYRGPMTGRERVRFSARQWIDLLLLVLLVTTHLALDVALGRGWWSAVLMLVELGVLIRIAIWLVPIVRERA